jgi:hypothetical protein
VANDGQWQAVKLLVTAGLVGITASQKLPGNRIRLIDRLVP